MGRTYLVTIFVSNIKQEAMNHEEQIGLSLNQLTQFFNIS